MKILRYMIIITEKYEDHTNELRSKATCETFKGMRNDYYEHHDHFMESVEWILSCYNF